MVYIATFFSHFGAIRFKKKCEENGLSAKTMPVPRNLSSSCGTCVRYTADIFCPVSDIPDELEQIVEVTEKGYSQKYLAENC